MQVRRDQLRPFEFVQRIFLDVFPQCRAAAFRVLRHERQLEHLGLDETTRLVCRDGPDDVRHTVARLIEKLRRRSAQLHRRIDLAFQASTGFLVDFVAPRVEELGLDRRLRRQKVMDLEDNLLRQSAARIQRDRGRKRAFDPQWWFHFSSFGLMNDYLNVWTR